MLKLRPYKDCDAEYIAKWILNEKSFYQWSADIIGKYPMTAEDLNQHYGKMKDNPDFWQMSACDDKNIPVGHMIMRFLDEDKKKLRFGFIIVDNKIRGKGYGKQMLQLAIWYAFEMLQVEEITLGVFANNPSAIHCYKAAGFQEWAEPTSYSILEENWECIELGIKKPCR